MPSGSELQEIVPTGVRRDEVKVYHGDDAVKAAAKYYGVRGILDPIAVDIIREEGFVPGVYNDSKGIPTEGVGQTGEKIGKNFFTEVLPEYVNKARKTTKDFNRLPEKAQSAITSMAYRGDWGSNTKKALKQGKWTEAAKQYLDHSEYRKGKAKNATRAQQAIAARMERNAQTLLALDNDEWND